MCRVSFPASDHRLAGPAPKSKGQLGETAIDSQGHFGCPAIDKTAFITLSRLISVALAELLVVEFAFCHRKMVGLMH